LKAFEKVHKSVPRKVGQKDELMAEKWVENLVKLLVVGMVYK